MVAPNGLGLDAHWDATVNGRSGLGHLSRFDPSSYPVRIGGEVRDFEPKDHVPTRLRPQTDRVTQFALTAAGWALGDAGVSVVALGEYDVGVVTANGCGGFEFGQHELQKLWGGGFGRVSAYQSFAWFYAVNTGQIAIRYGAKGHSSVVVSEQAGGLDALAHATRLLRNDTLKIAVAGGMEAPLCPWGLAAQIPNGRMSTGWDASRAYLPFDRAASGYAPGEGGALLILEDERTAHARGADQVYGEIVGYAATFDPRPGSGRPPGLARAIRGALAQARVDPLEVDVVVADGAGLPDLDRAEASAIAEVFGPRGVPVSVPKSLIGRLYSGGATLDVVSGFMMIRDGVIPGLPYEADVPAEYDIDVVVGAAREQRVDTVLVIARGNGGFNSVVVLRRPQ